MDYNRYIGGGNLRGTMARSGKRLAQVYESGVQMGKAMSKGRRKRSARGLITRSLSNHTYIRRATPIQITMNQFTGFSNCNGATTSGYGIAWGFALDNVYMKYSGGQAVTVGVNYSDLTGLYDMYRIRKVTMDMYWTNNDSFNTNNAYVLPLLQMASDYDDLTAPTGNNTLTQFSTFVLRQLGNRSHFRHTVYPKVSNGVNTVSSLGTSGTQLQKAPFLNTFPVTTAG